MSEIAEWPTGAYLAKMMRVIAEDAMRDGCYVLDEDDQHIVVAGAAEIERLEARVRTLETLAAPFASEVAEDTAGDVHRLREALEPR